MNEAAQTLSQALEVLSRRIRKTKALHVNRSEDKEAVRSFVKSYFGEFRLQFPEDEKDTALTELDAQIQSLLRLAQNRTTPSDFRRCLLEIRHSVDALELHSVRPLAKIPVKSPVGEHHVRLIASLHSVKPSAALAFEQGLIDLHQTDRKSWRGTTVEFREALRETLDALAPDEAVIGQPGYKQEADTKGPTMKQKAIFILKSRRPKDPQVKAFGDAIDVIEELIGKFIRSVYTRSSVAVHVADSKEEAKKVRDYVALVLGELLEVKE